MATASAPPKKQQAARPPDSSSPHPAAFKSQQVTPESDGLQTRMKVSKEIVDELLLVCGVIGTTVNESNEMVPVSDCLNWLQDLQRALRRDDDNFRPISLLLSSWKVVQQKLLPIVLHSRYDTAIVLTICKILVILTKPLSDTTINAGRRVINPNQKKIPESVVKQQIKLRDNAIQQAETLVDYKRAVCQGSLKGTGVLSIFVSLLAEPLSKSGSSRTDADHLCIELVLHLLRNLLAAQPLLKSSEAEELHHELVHVFEKELVLEILLVLAGDIEHRENAQYNLLLMELLHSLLRHQDPMMVTQSAHSSSQNSSRTMAKKHQKGSLLTSLNRERQHIQSKVGNRHSQFGGALTIEVGDKKKTLSTTTLGQKKKQALPRSKTTRKTEPFIGSSNKAAMGPAATKAAQTLHRFCTRFVHNCYGPVMKSLKNEFRRDSVRLEESDKCVFFKLAQFFCQWWRVSRSNAPPSPASSNSGIGQLIFTMDIFTFNLVMDATDSYQQHKNYSSLSQAVSLLLEMMHLLNLMYCSDEQTEKIMAMGLMDRLFYNNEPKDRLPKLLSNWKTGTASRHYLSDLAEICHMTLKLLDTHKKFCSSDLMRAEHSKHDSVAQMKTVAADFDVDSYFARRIISNHSVVAYTHLLSQYADNSATVNHRVVAFFLRLCKHKIALGDDVDVAASTPLAAKPVTFEPMIYTIQMLTVLNTILNDTNIRNDKSYSTLLQFATMIVHNFATAAKANPMLFVEALFKHPFPHRFCELSTNMYVDEDMRMMAERDLLLMQHKKLEEEEKKLQNDEDSDDDELEFVDEPSDDSDQEVATKTIQRKKPSKDKNPEKAVLNDSDDDSDTKKESNTASSPTKVSAGTKLVPDDSEDDNEVGAPSKPTISSPSKPSGENMDDSDDESDSEEAMERELREMAEKTKRQSEELKKRLRELENFDDEHITSPKKGKFDFSDSDDDEK